MKFVTTLCATLVLATTTASAAFDLQITEIWMGNEPGSNLTEDWIEVTNFGDMAWVASATSQLYFDDDSADPEAADLISGVATIAPGESVIFVDGSATIGGSNVIEFVAVWGAAASGVQIGTYEGSGMSQGGDGATLFISNGQPLLDFTNVTSAALELYPDANAFGGQSWDVVNNKFSELGNPFTAALSAVANDEGQFGIASLGSAVPEPTSALLAGLATLAIASLRRR